MSISPLRSPIKYPGGKRKLFAEINQRLPPGSFKYAEPFFGGGSIGLQLAGEGRLTRFVAGEACGPVRAFWETLANSKHVLEAHLRVLVELSDQKSPSEFYERCRQQLNSRDCDPALEAALLLILNKTCNNGIVRFNRSGEFNVSLGKKQDGSYHRFKPDFDHLDRCHLALRGAGFQIHPTWADALAPIADGWTPDRPRDTWAVYADPPYTGGFVGYTPEGWTSDDDIKLFTSLAWASDYGARVVLSQPDTEWARDCCSGILKGWQVDRLEVARPANSDGEGRGPVGELLIWNKPVEKAWVPVTGTVNFSCGQDKPVERVMAPAEPSPIVLNITVASDDNCGLA